MTSKLGRTSDHTTFIIASIFLLAASQAFEMVTFPVGILLQAVSLSLAIFSITWASYVYLTAREAGRLKEI